MPGCNVTAPMLATEVDPSDNVQPLRERILLLLLYNSTNSALGKGADTMGSKYISLITTSKACAVTGAFHVKPMVLPAAITLLLRSDTLLTASVYAVPLLNGVLKVRCTKEKSLISRAAVDGTPNPCTE